jgi:succinate dehydrogenase / fumarate reductase cytochrome b subunit
MDILARIFSSSIGKKFIVGLTGLCLCIYLVVHVAGNLLLFKDDGGAAFDKYAEILPSIFLILIIEKVLFAVFLAHIIGGVYLWLQNRRARPGKYAMTKPAENSALTSRTMFVTGSVVFIFLVIHIRTFWFTSRFQAGEHFSMYSLVRESFANPLYTAFYVAAMVLLGLHLRHGFQSAFQTFGLKTQRYAPIIEAVGMLFWLVIPLGFASMPIYFYLTK